MIIKILLVISIMIAFSTLIRSHNTTRLKATKKIGILFFFLVSIVSILFPELTTTVAHLVGVGRGADLLLYITIVVVVAHIFNQYEKNKEYERRLVRLARKVAILDANNRYNLDK